MIQTRTLVGLCMLCALLISAFAAQSASASKGTTAFTCVKDEAAGTLSGEHCLAAGGSGKHKHAAIAQDTTTEVITTTEKTQNNTTETGSARLRMTIGGIAAELLATLAHSEGWMENKVEPGAKGEHHVIAHTSNTFTNVKMVKPAGLGCKVYTSNEDTSKGEEGVLHTTPLKVTTTGEGDSGRLEATDTSSGDPSKEGVIAHFILDGCVAPVTGLNGPYTVQGSITCPVNGATVACTHPGTTAADTLKLNGAIKAGLELSTTFKGREKGSGSAYTPLSPTTVET
jgi:hypothetical protein